MVSIRVSVVTSQNFHLRVTSQIYIDVKKTFLRFLLFFIKDAFFNGLIFLQHFLFSSGTFLSPTKPAKILLNLLNSCTKRLLNDGFKITAILNSLTNSRRAYSSNVDMHIKTVILMRDFLFGLINFANLSRTFFIQRILTFFILFIKTAFLTFFMIGVNVFLHLCKYVTFSDHMTLKVKITIKLIFSAIQLLLSRTIGPSY